MAGSGVGLGGAPRSSSRKADVEHGPGELVFPFPAPDPSDLTVAECGPAAVAVAVVRLRCTASGGRRSDGEMPSKSTFPRFFTSPQVAASPLLGSLIRGDGPRSALANAFGG